MSILDNFNNRVMRGTSNSKELKNLQLRQSFEKYMNQNPTGVELYVTDPECFPTLNEEGITLKNGVHIDGCHKETMVINDIVYNDKTSYDEKYVKVRYDSKVNVGCYFWMDDCWWIIQFKDHKEFKNMKRFTARCCNQYIKYKYENTLIELPVLVQNLTMYADGLADFKYNTTLDSKRHIFYGSNIISRYINIPHRLMVDNEHVFEVTHVNKFEYNGGMNDRNGLIKTLVTQCESLDRDDKDNNIAYNPYDELDDNQLNDNVFGSDTITIGSSSTYKLDGIEEDYTRFEWSIVSSTPFAKIVYSSKNECTVSIDDEIDAIGEVVELKFNYWVNTVKKEIVFDILVKGV